MTTKDYYTTLGVSRSATEEEIKQAFRRLAMKFHPDRNKAPGAEDQFKEMKTAYETLSDTTLRKKYDYASVSPSFSTSATWTKAEQNDIVTSKLNDVIGLYNSYIKKKENLLSDIEAAKTAYHKKYPVPPAIVKTTGIKGIFEKAVTIATTSKAEREAEAARILKAEKQREAALQFQLSRKSVREDGEKILSYVKNIRNSIDDNHLASRIIALKEAIEGFDHKKDTMNVSYAMEKLQSAQEDLESRHDWIENGLEVLRGDSTKLRYNITQR